MPKCPSARRGKKGDEKESLVSEEAKVSEIRLAAVEPGLDNRSPVVPSFWLSLANEAKSRGSSAGEQQASRVKLRISLCDPIIKRG
jgi:hypothetical protein